MLCGLLQGKEGSGAPADVCPIGGQQASCKTCPAQAGTSCGRNVLLDGQHQPPLHYVPAALRPLSFVSYVLQDSHATAAHAALHRSPPLVQPQACS